MKGRKVLLVNPWIYDFAAYDLWAKPLGLLYLGAVLRRNGCDVRLIDCMKAFPESKPGGQGKFPRQIIPKPAALKFMPRHYARYGIGLDTFAAMLDKAGIPDAVLVTSMMTYWYPGVVTAIRMVKERFPEVPVILGGVYATLCEDHARKVSGADYVITHEGEEKVLDLLGTLWGAAPDFMPDMQALDSLPYPCFDLMEDLRYVCIRATRGCPYRCTYCASRYLCGPQRRRDPAKVADEIEFWNRRQGVQDFAFYDDALLTPQKEAKILLSEIIRRNLGVRFHCPNGLHAREITGETAVLMKRAGFSTIRIGLETAEPGRQVRTGGKVTNQEFVRAMESLYHAGFGPEELGVYILCGLPGQGAEEVEEAVRFVRENGGRPRLSEYSPLPHTKDWDEAVRSCPYPIEEEPLYHNNSLLVCRSDRFTYEQYQEIKNDIKRSLSASP
jgi:hypothetical protein